MEPDMDGGFWTRAVVAVCTMVAAIVFSSAAGFTIPADLTSMFVMMHIWGVLLLLQRIAHTARKWKRSVLRVPVWSLVLAIAYLVALGEISLSSFLFVFTAWLLMIQVHGVLLRPLHDNEDSLLPGHFRESRSLPKWTLLVPGARAAAILRLGSVDADILFVWTFLLWVTLMVIHEIVFRSPYEDFVVTKTTPTKTVLDLEINIPSLAVASVFCITFIIINIIA